MGVLIGFLDPIGKFFGSVLGTAWDVISGFVDVIGGFVTKYVIEPIMYLTMKPPTTSTNPDITSHTVPKTEPKNLPIGSRNPNSPPIL